jgi:hypothetical protein
VNILNKKSNIQRICKKCGNPFTVKGFTARSTSGGRKNSGIFCSTICRYQYMTGKNNHRYNKRGNGWKDGYGYISYNVDGKRIKRCRHVMEQILGRKLFSTESVHHKNGIRSDDSPKNLELWTSNHPTGVRVSDLNEWAINYLQSQGYIIEMKLKQIAING